MGGNTCSIRDVTSEAPASDATCEAAVSVSEPEVPAGPPICSEDSPQFIQFLSQMRSQTLPQQNFAAKVQVDYSQFCGPQTPLKKGRIFDGKLLTTKWDVQEHVDCPLIYKHAEFLKDFVARCDADFNHLGSFPFNLIDTSKRELLKLFDYFTPNEVWTLVALRIRTRSDLDMVLKNRDAILEIKKIFYDACDKLSSANSTCNGDWLDILALLPSRVFLENLRDKFMEFLKRSRDQIIESDTVTSFGNGLEVIKDNFLELCSAFTLDKTKEAALLKNADAFFRILGLAHATYRLGLMINKLLGSDLTLLPKLALALEAIIGNSYVDCHYSLACIVDKVLVPKKFRGYMLSTLVDSLTNRDSDLISRHYDNFLRLAGQWKIEAGAIGNIYRNIPRDILENDPELLIDIARGASEDHVSAIFESIAALSNRAYVKQFAKYLGNAYPPVVAMLDYFALIEYPAGKLADILRHGDYISLSDLLINHRTGTDLRNFSMREKDTYIALFESLRKAGMTDYESRIRGSLKFDRFEAEMKGKSLLEISAVIDEIGNTIDPSLKKGLQDEFLVEPASRPGAFTPILRKWHNPKTGMIDVTQNNLKEINTLINLLMSLAHPRRGGSMANPDSINESLRAIFPNFSGRPNFGRAIEWLANRFDVEEINFSRLKGLGLLAEYMELRDNIDRLKNEPAVRYLDNRLKDLDLARIFGDDGGPSLDRICDIKYVEDIRRGINKKSKTMGDQVIDGLGISFLESRPASFDTLSDLLAFSRAWSISGDNSMDSDVSGLYRQYSHFGFAEIADFVKNGIRQCGGDEEKLAAYSAMFKRRGVDFGSLVNELESRGFEIRMQGNAAKGASRILSHPFYTARRFVQKMGSDAAIKYDRASLEFRRNRWTARNAIDVKEMYYEGRKVATIIKCSGNGAGVKVLAERSGLVDTKGAIDELGRRYVFSAPLTMTTGQRKMTELVFRDGEQINWLLTPHGKDGLLIVDKNGNPRILDKREIKIGDILAPRDLSDPPIKNACAKWWKMTGNPGECPSDVLEMTLQPSERIKDKLLFLKLLMIKKMSLLPGMLLINGGETHRFEDGKTSRRFFVEFSDSSFGIMDSDEDMTTADMVDLSLAAGVTRAVYMDTGMYDMATYRDGAGADHLLGHPDTSESTNRVVIYSK